MLLCSWEDPSYPLLQLNDSDDDTFWNEFLQLQMHHNQAALIHLEVKLAQKSGRLPEFLFVKSKDVTRDPEFCGGQADVFRGTYRGQPVALKRLRFFTRMTPQEKETSAKVHGVDTWITRS